MSFHPIDKIIVSFDKNRQLLILEKAYSDGSMDMLTHIELSRLEAMGIDTACHALGENILIGMPTTREELFTKKRE
jgi:hypothetical protein